MTLQNLINLRNLNGIGALKVLNHTAALRSAKGFTIVELLIVIVVIAILATISIVAYSGIQTRAKTTAAQANAASTQKTAETYYADNNVYPTTKAMFNNSLVRLPANINILIGANTLSSTSKETDILYRYTTSALGACIFYWKFSTGAITSGTDIIYLGNASSTNCNATTLGTTPAS